MQEVSRRRRKEQGGAGEGMANQILALKNESLNLLVEKLEERVKCPVCLEVPRCDPLSVVRFLDPLVEVRWGT